jgi:hypothetical protein
MTYDPTPPPDPRETGPSGLGEAGLGVQSAFSL